jgi:hypothetical protein
MAENGKELEGDGRQRPETTDIVARRIIGSVLGINLAKRTDEKSIAFDLALKEKRTKQAAELGSLAEGHVIEAENNVVADTRTKAVQWSHANWGVGETEEGDEKWRLFAQRARESAKKGLRAAAEGKEPLDSWGRLAVERGLKAVEVSIESLRKESQATESDDEG